MASDYDLWVHFDDVETLNAAMAALDLEPNHPAPEARARGRYVDIVFLEALKRRPPS